MGKKKVIDASRHHDTSPQELACLSREIAKKEVEHALKKKVKHDVKGMAHFEHMAYQNKIIQSTATEIERLLAKKALSEEKFEELRNILKGVHKKELKENVKKVENINGRLALAAQRELTIKPNLSAERKANLRKMIKKISENDQLVIDIVNREWQRVNNNSSGFH